MKIGLLSVQNHNYGSILQAFALQSYLLELGNDVEIIRYKKTNYFKQASRLLYLPLLKATVKTIWKSVYCKLFRRKIYTDILASRENAFLSFKKKWFRYSQVYTGRNNLVAGTQKYDCFVLGSDQVWNPMNLGGDFFTMTFIPENINKVAYAPSFGVSSVPMRQKRKTSLYLKRIDHISVREADGVRIVKELIDRDVQQVVDPTILVGREFWDGLIKDPLVSSEYIFCYFISPNKEYRSFALELARKTGLKIVAIPFVDEFVKADVGFGDYVPGGVGPLEFVSFIKNAKYVCTDSFHGSVFSVMYEVPFFTFSRYKEDSEDSTNSRLYSFLNMVGLKQRLYYSGSVISEEDLNALDFSSALTILKQKRNGSIQYLKEALEG